ncbi:plasmid mobilization protein, partial [Vibrio aestuarianus]
MQNKNKTIKVRLTPEQKEEVINKKGALSVSAYVRNAVLDSNNQDRKIILVADPGLVSQLAAIGNLLNQSVRIANIQTKSGYPLDCEKLLMAI